MVKGTSLVDDSQTCPGRLYGRTDPTPHTRRDPESLSPVVPDYGPEPETVVPWDEDRRGLNSTSRRRGSSARPWGEDVDMPNHGFLVELRPRRVESPQFYENSPLISLKTLKTKDSQEKKGVGLDFF